MAVLQYKHLLKNNLGFTLIEVLIALVIISISLTAVIMTTSQNIKSTHHLQQKIIATWAAENIINEIKTGIINKSSTNEDSNDIKILNNILHYKVKLTPTSNSKIQKIEVDIFNNKNESKIIKLTSFLYEK
ncbi:type II secretion system minor pseudopilin GspI [Gammaproteobacteria bacterium]|nr:type II secretion system minor pseudopilin GspI [Gammaproteobacteria bacterium]